ncbi:maleylpyruvate isomerase N-terminal domain-containing protein [Luedemannella helvata]|uniref:Maleylpyruvate isomerase family mycothiol-dependent enzyme n=1 Tax=Luedemannella helvata TaxID=349315 RepID=A0ABP4XCC2_9ACTN
MDNDRLRECLDEDYTRLRKVAAGADLAARVPSCPDWTVAELVDHVAMVYLHKVACMKFGRPQEWPPETGGEEPLPLLERAYGELAAEFATRAPSTSAYTWYEPDQTVGFWVRRMAQETVIHRVDAELGAGVPIAPIPADLALDGIDELLVAFVSYGSRAWAEDFADVLAPAAGTTVHIAAGERAWSVEIAADGVSVADASGGVGTGASTSIAGEPDDVLLWLWNRAGDGAVTTSGDPDALAAFRRVLVAATQ